MNGDSPHGGQPWSVDLLADLHADGGDRSRLDADALAVLAALDATQAELAALPPMRMPDDVAARIDAALAAEAAARSATQSPVTPHQLPAPAAGPVPPVVPQVTTTGAMPPGTSPQPPVPLRPAAGPMTPPHASAPVAPVVDLAEARRRRNRLLGIAGGLLTAAAVAVGVVVVTVPGGSTGGTPQAIPNTSIQTDPQNNGPLTLHSGDLPGAGAKAIGAQDYGPFTDAGKLRACLVANGLDAGAKPIFGRRATVDGKPAVMLLLPTGKAVHYQLLVVGTDCAAGNPATLANTTIGG
ncbi:hypothetical protein [Kutzneria kofuensis]|uniref:Uncharacterized protein n=1 Tax=Kutzneria kofuensis TaxID=103725 RepID=A0A7W9KHS6_9PSEU|nr:hypothetical protein [Kutzneria kofuensis]MBB5892660.1 hypothetical protein [Kutzneria kofuensis]